MTLRTASALAWPLVLLAVGCGFAVIVYLLRSAVLNAMP